MTLVDPRCLRCDAAINVQRLQLVAGSTTRWWYVSDCCGAPFAWPPEFAAPVKGN